MLKLWAFIKEEDGLASSEYSAIGAMVVILAMVVFLVRMGAGQ